MRKMIIPKIRKRNGTIFTFFGLRFLLLSNRFRRFTVVFLALIASDAVATERGIDEIVVVAFAIFVQTKFFSVA